jgi:hypothetical protein
MVGVSCRGWTHGLNDGICSTISALGPPIRRRDPTRLGGLSGLSDCQARSKAKLDFHFKRWAFNQHLLDRICEHLAKGQSLEKAGPDYKDLCNYGIITKEAA